MVDREYSAKELQDRCAIEDLYDRQLLAAERFDLELYDTTFTEDARLDLADFGLEPCGYPRYREWLASLEASISFAHRVRGGLRLTLLEDAATTDVPVTCNVGFGSGDGVVHSQTGIFYRDKLVRTEEGWRVSERREVMSWSK